MRQLLDANLLLINTLPFTCGERKICSIIKVPKYYEHDCLQNFILLFIPLLTAFVVKNSHILAGIYFIFLKNGPIPNLQGFQYQIWTLVKRSQKQLSSKTYFSTFCKLVALTLG